MRLWTIHPAYLDAKGLVAAWREGLLAQKVLAGETKGYRNHPQLLRFSATREPRAAIAAYLRDLADEAEQRGYRFDRSKIRCPSRKVLPRIKVGAGQIAYEFALLKFKLRKRDFEKFTAIAREGEIRLGPLFELEAGGIADWERPIAEIVDSIKG